MKVLITLSSVLLLSLTSFAQSPSGERTNYGLYFNEPLSRLMLGQTGKPLNFGPQQTLTNSSSRCGTAQVRYQEDGNMMCFLDTSCQAEALNYPSCVYGFNGPTGETLERVAKLVPVPNSETSSGASNMIELGDEPSPEAIHAAMPRSNTGQ